MMNSAFDQVIGADDETRLGLYTTTDQCLGTTPQNVEKDFWVCWPLDALFNGLAVRPRLLFKGGTSLSKGFGVIKRFSEDTDVTVFRDDLGETASIEELQALSGKKRGKALDAIKAACEAYINGPCLPGLSAIVGETAKRNGLGAERFFIEPDPEDGQALYVRYPTATPEDVYVGKAVIAVSVDFAAEVQSAIGGNATLNIERVGFVNLQMISHELEKALLGRSGGASG